MRWNYAVSRAPYGPSVRGTIRGHQMHYLLSKSWLGAFSFHLTTCPSFLLCHKDSFLSSCCTRTGKLGSYQLQQGEKGRYQGTISLIKTSPSPPSPPPLLLDWRRVSLPSGRKSESPWFRVQKSVRSVHSLIKSHEAAQRWEKPGP